MSPWLVSREWTLGAQAEVGRPARILWENGSGRMDGVLVNVVATKR